MHIYILELSFIFENLEMITTNIVGDEIQSNYYITYFKQQIIKYFITSTI